MGTASFIHGFRSLGNAVEAGSEVGDHRTQREAGAHQIHGGNMLEIEGNQQYLQISTRHRLRLLDLYG